MKKLLLLCVASLPLWASSIVMTAEFSPEQLRFEKSGEYDAVELAGYPARIIPGMPRVPRVVHSLLIPSGAQATGVELLEEEWLTLPGEYYLGPAQPDVPLPQPNVKSPIPHYSPDPAAYSSDEPYPETKIRLCPSGTMAGYRIANVELLPVRYKPASRQLLLARRLVYRLNYIEQSPAVLATERQRAIFGNAVRRIVKNAASVTAFAPEVKRMRSATVLPPGEYDYVVVTEAPMDTVFARLAAWKTQRGVPGTVVLLSWISANYPGYDLAEKLRNFIIDAHNTWGTVYVLLGGQGDYQTSGQNIIPTRMANYSGNGDEPCDLYYAGLDGNWDRNNNHVYGELPDSADMYSDVYVGRAPVYNVPTAQNFVRKVIRYEQNPPSGYLRKMNLATGILWSSYEERPMQESIARMTPPGWIDQRLYERTGALSRQIMIDTTNLGWGIGHLEGHGNESGIYMGGGSTPFITSSDADALVNGDKCGLAISIACDPAAWDFVPGGDCFAEHMVNNTHGGMIACIMNTRYGYGAIGPGGNYVPGPSERLDTTICAGILNWGLYHTGEALGYSKASWAPYADSLYQYDMQRYCIYDLNLIGDPETPIWTDEPTYCNCEHLQVINIGSSIPFTVTVTNPVGTPIADARVTLRKGNEVNISGRTGPNGRVTLIISPVTPGIMTVGVDAHNYFYRLDTVQVISTARYVIHHRSQIYDPPPGGNGDSILNPGETVRILTWVKNWGSATASSVTGRLRTRDVNASITDSVKSFGNIAAGDSAFTGINGFGLQVNNIPTNGYTIACSLFCRDALDSTWVSTVGFVVGTPVLQKHSLTVRDSGIGNGNGKVDPGETANLQIELVNTGLGHGYNCRARLRSGDSRLQVLDSTANYGFIRQGTNSASTTDWYQVAAAPEIPLETPVPCTLYLQADGGYLRIEVFCLTVGEIRAVDPIPDGPRTPALYYAYDDVDLAYPEHPTYNWIEIKTVGTRLTYPQNDDVLMITIPPAFGPLRFYGQRYTQLSISADGWLCPGNYTTRHYNNTRLPDPATPPGMICLNWDDLYPNYNSQGYVYWYHDTIRHCLIIEYDSVAYYNPTSVRDKFQALIYDTTITTPSGDNLIIAQYMTANRYTSSTLGIEDPTRTIAIEAAYNASCHRGCAPIAPGRAIAYLTDPPGSSGIAGEESPLNGDTRLRLEVAPRPFTGAARIYWVLPAATQVSLRVYDAGGRLVRKLVDGNMKAGCHTAEWNGRADNGKPVPAGSYILVLRTEQGVRQCLGIAVSP